ncbi:MAG: DNA topoisomerase I [Acidobacteria bacterium RBG_16_70_10]|nr:MAG: DNA topoisomerase I [Acidobacteria bacterium RBG_16_70_10]
MARNLVIVESPAKAKTINKYLGRDFAVKASMGHVRDLPRKKLGVDIKRGFAAEYEVLPARKKVLEELRTAAKDAETVYLAADPDREGEAICWHLSEELAGRGGKGKRKFRRVVFNEITKRAIEDAFRNPVDVDPKKVDAQQARRVLDRLVGYKVSPILWEKVRRGLSAGRVQSVALRLICDREREIRAFVPEEYWSVVARLAAALPPLFAANLLKRDGKNVEIGSAEEAASVRRDLEAAVFRVDKILSRERKRNPVPPFITSKLQQEAFRRLRFSVRKTMQVAQRLYEGIELGHEGSVGLITYMRTDSTRVAAEALDAVRGHIASTYGGEHVPDKPNFYRSKKDAQDAHEAIRPTEMSRAPEAVRRFLGKDELALYTLIWNRFVASQMRPAVYDETIVDIGATPPAAAPVYLLRAKGSTLKFKGFLAVYEEARDEKVETTKQLEEPHLQADDTEPETGEQLPPLEQGQRLELRGLETEQHFTQPPPRFSEASLVKELEENGIGRPSTYATIIATIETREYIEKRESKLWPTELGFIVTDLLTAHFADIMNVEYTAAMEEELDEIEEGRDNFLNTLNQFWKKFEADLKKAQAEMKDIKRLEEQTEEVCDKCGRGMVIKWGRYGKFLACSGYPECKNTRQLAGGEGTDTPDVHEDVAGTTCPKDGQPMVLKKGRYGPFLACSRYPECKETRRLVRGEGGKLQVEQLQPIEEKCPQCGSELMWKRGRFGPFVACSSYPTCKYIKKKEAKPIGLVCPDCHEGQVVERKGRWGRSFYGCSRYPECRFTAYHRPLAEVCPECSRPYLLEKETKKEGRVVYCGNEACHYKRVA